MFSLQPPRHIPTLPDRYRMLQRGLRRFGPAAPRLVEQLLGVRCLIGHAGTRLVWMEAVTGWGGLLLLARVQNRVHPRAACGTCRGPVKLTGADGGRASISILLAVTASSWRTHCGAFLMGELHGANSLRRHERGRSPMLIGSVFAGASRYSVDPGFLRHMGPPHFSRCRAAVERGGAGAKPFARGHRSSPDTGSL
jgi:hypothetical protein